MNDLRIITCPQWGAVKSREPIQVVKASTKIIIHHTAGHHPEISDPRNESLEEAMRYARDIQHAHMSPGGLGTEEGGIDSGHNFLVCRNGAVLQGRWLTVSAIQAGHMVLSAHCPTQNGQVGIEHEHKGNEPMTAEQRDASARLIAWISMHYGKKRPLPLFPHRQFYSTACPANLAGDMPELARRATSYMRI